MSAREPVTADDVEAAVTAVLKAAGTAVDRDWSVPAGTLTWDCRRTADHLGHCLFAYAGQLALQPRERYLSFGAFADEDATPAEVLEFVAAGGRILAAMVRSSTRDTRGFHPYGLADPEGFAGMGCVETLIHGHDIATGLGVTIDPPREVCARVLARMFPDLGPTGLDPWTELRYATGRVAPPDLPPVTTWRWRGAPLDG